jgi:phosphate transport system substrate-binding protein
MRLRFVTVVMLLAAALAGCGRKSSGGLTIAGSTSIQPFAEKWAEEYQGKHSGKDIQVQGGGSTAGVQAALSGAAQIGMCSRELKAEEEGKLYVTVVARDGLTIVVHPSQRVSDVTVEQVRGIYTGKITNWKELGGEDRKITVVTRENGSGARGAFEEMAMHKETILASALVQDSQGAVRQMVSTDAGAIGYIAHGMVDGSVKALKLAGVEASVATVTSGAYPLVRPFLFLPKGPPAGEAKALIDWILGPEGQAVAVKEGLFSPK